MAPSHALPHPCLQPYPSSISRSFYLCLCLYQTWKPGGGRCHCQTTTSANVNAITSMEHWSLEIYIYLCRSQVQYSTAREAGIEAAACRRSSVLSTTMRLILQSGVHKRGPGFFVSSVQRVLHNPSHAPLVVRTAAAAVMSYIFPLVKGTSPVREIAWIAIGFKLSSPISVTFISCFQNA